MMSGGHFEHRQRSAANLADDLLREIEEGEGVYSNLEQQTLLQMKVTAEVLELASELVNEIDLLVCGDHSNCSFSESWQKKYSLLEQAVSAQHSKTPTTDEDETSR